jgi:hypothetical protein
MIVLF